MTDYYVDIGSPGAWNGRTGLDHTGNEWLGLSGFQKAADTVTAGNTIYIKEGAVICTTLKNITYDNLSGTFTVGEEVRVDASNKGIVSEDTGTILTVEVTAGAFADNNTMTGQTSGATADVNVTVAVKSIGLNIDTNAGDIANGFVKFIGVNSSWVNDGTRCKLDGNAGAIAGCLDIIKWGAIDYLYFENIEVDDADDDGFEYTTGGDYCVFINCWAHHCDDDGFNVGAYNIFIRCLSTNNGGEGFKTGSNNRFIFCVAHNSGSKGFAPNGTGGVFIGCIIAENTTDGIYAYLTQTILFSTIDENSDGIKIPYGKNTLIMFNRITTQGDDGIIANAGYSCYEDWNLFYGNTGDDRDDSAGAGLIEQGGNSKTDSAGDGYTDQAGHDFNLTDSADYRREAITLPKWDGTSP